MSLHVFDVAQFRKLFPAFASEEQFPDTLLQIYWDVAITYIAPFDNFALCGAALQLALNQLTAHIAQSMSQVNSGDTPGVLTGATEGSVSASLQAPPTKDGFTWWLSTTPYGTMLRALLLVKSAAGFYVGGLPERSAYRKVGGVF